MKAADGPLWGRTRAEAKGPEKGEGGVNGVHQPFAKQYRSEAEGKDRQPRDEVSRGQRKALGAKGRTDEAFVMDVEQANPPASDVGQRVRAVPGGERSLDVGRHTRRTAH